MTEAATKGGKRSEEDMRSEGRKIGHEGGSKGE